MKLGIIGCGHIGLVTAACFAKLGHDVIGVDNNEIVVESLSLGVAHFHEPGLQDLLEDALSEGRIRFTTSIEEAVAESEVLFICVNTPPLENGAADLSFVEAVARRLAACMTEYRLIVEKSTVPAKTGERVARTLRLLSAPGTEFDVVSFPEFSREGSGIKDFMEPDRIVLGVQSARAR